MQPEGNTEKTSEERVQLKRKKGCCDCIYLCIYVYMYFVANSQQLFRVIAGIHVTPFTSAAVTADRAQLCQNPLCLTRLVFLKT